MEVSYSQDCSFDKVVLPEINEKINGVRLPWSVESRTAALQSSIRAEWSGTYRSCALPHSSTCLNFSRLLFWLRRNMNDRLTFGASFIASCSNETDFFSFCMNHIPEDIVLFWKEQFQVLGIYDFKINKFFRS